MASRVGSCGTCRYFKRRNADGDGTCWHVNRVGSATKDGWSCADWLDRLANRWAEPRRATMTPRQHWTLAGWLVALALMLCGAAVWPLEAPWFALLMLAVTEEAWFLFRGEPTLSQRYWAIPPRAKLITSLIVAAGMVILALHLFWGFLR